MSWIKTISYAEAKGTLKKLYSRVKGPNDNVDNVLKIHSLRPHTLTGHMAIYKNVLHNASNTLPKWYLEALGIYVSELNGCDYCVRHHQAGFERIYPESEKAKQLLDVIRADKLGTFFENKYLSGFSYAKVLTQSHKNINEQNIQAMRASGMDDGQILEINQVVSYFNYVNRVVLGLGVTTDGDVLGLSPNDNSDPDNCSHH